MRSVQTLKISITYLNDSENIRIQATTGLPGPTTAVLRTMHSEAPLGCAFVRLATVEQASCAWKYM